MSLLDEVAATHAATHGLDPDDLAARTRAQAARRHTRGQRPAKRCGRCKTARPALDFAEDTRQLDGLKSTCRECDRHAARRRRARLGGRAY